jgi:hypothetical protein
MPTYTKEETIAKLAQWFPNADSKNLRAFVDSGWDGDVDAAGLDVMASAFQEGEDCEFPDYLLNIHKEFTIRINQQFCVAPGR